MRLYVSILYVRKSSISNHGLCLYLPSTGDSMALYCMQDQRCKNPSMRIQGSADSDGSQQNLARHLPCICICNLVSHKAEQLSIIFCYVNWMHTKILQPITYTRTQSSLFSSRCALLTDTYDKSYHAAALFLLWYIHESCNNEDILYSHFRLNLDWMFPSR